MCKFFVINEQSFISRPSRLANQAAYLLYNGLTSYYKKQVEPFYGPAKRKRVRQSAFILPFLKLFIVDPKPSDLIMSRLTCTAYTEDRTRGCCKILG